MPRLTKPQAVDDTRLQATRELLKAHAERRTAVRMNDGPLTKHFYECGIPTKEIAEEYGSPLSTIYAILKRQPIDCHPEGQTCTTCGAVEGSE